MSLLQAKNVDVLVVEDSYTQALKLEQLFDKQGLSVACADGAGRALMWLENYRPSVIISDVLMPDMDGFELCRQIKANEKIRHVPVVLLTRLSEPEDIVRGLECGADHFVTKPFDCSLLVSQVHNILLNQKIRRQKRGDDGVEIFFAGNKHVINSERSQILDLLLSTYEGALQQKRELERMNTQLNEALETIKKRNAEIAELAVRDSMTGTFNRGYFNETFPGAIRRAQRYAQSLSLIMCDIDHFKLINDHYGHQTGDQVIRSVAESLGQSLRQGVDWLARYGGEEFIIVLPETELAGANVVAERMRQTVAEKEISCEPQNIRLTASFGVAGCSSEHATMLTANGMIAAADRCLYQAKKQGRNCCCSKALK